jgi:hypothetical protein
MRTALRLVLLSLLLATPAFAQNSQKAKTLRRDVIGKRALVRSAAATAIGTASNIPHEWGRGPAGIASRFGSSIGQHAIKGAVQIGVSTWHHENLNYQRSNLQGTVPRMKYALKATFIVPQTNRPEHKTVALGRVSGNMSAGLISRVWQPASTAGVGAGLASGGIGLAADVGVNIVREFWPQKRKPAAPAPVD